MAFYIYLKKIGSAHLPGKPDVSRIQIPQSTKFDCVIQSGLTFFAIGYDVVDRVYIIWNPEKVKQRLNQCKNFSLYSTFTYQHLVRVQQKSYHYISKQIQDAIIVLPDTLEDVLINPKSYFDSEEIPLFNEMSSQIDWEGMYTTSNGKLTALANPVLLEKLKECLLQPYPSIPYACNIIVEFYGTDRFPNMELSDWLGLINNIDWNLPDQIIAIPKVHQKEVREKVRLKSFDFLENGIPVGSELEYVDDPNIKVKVLNNRQIEYNGQETSVSKLAQQLKGFSHSVQGTLWFTYKGKRLVDIRKDNLGE